MVESAVAITVIFYCYLALFILLRIFVFKLILKNMKRPLSMFVDVTLFIATTMWLFSIWDHIWLHYESPPLQFATILYVMAVVDFVYNIYQYKKTKENRSLVEHSQ